MKLQLSVLALTACMAPVAHAQEDPPPLPTLTSIPEPTLTSIPEPTLTSIPEEPVLFTTTSLEPEPVLFTTTSLEPEPVFFTTTAEPPVPTLFTTTTADNKPPGVIGDPHFLSWAGKRFDYHGECDLVLVSAPKLDMDVHIRTTIRKHFSYVSSAVVRIGSEKLEIQSRGVVYLNDQRESSRSKLTFAGHEIGHTRPDAKHHRFLINLGEGYGDILIKTYVDFVMIFFDTTSKDILQGSHGLNGDYDSGMLLSREGQDLFDEAVVDPDFIGQDWQVRDTEEMLFHAVREPQYPQPCRYPEAITSQERRRLSEENQDLIKEANKVCGDLFVDVDDFDACVYDVISTGDIGLADAGVW